MAVTYFPSLKYCKLVEEMDPGIARRDPAFNISAVLLAMAKVGPFILKVEKETELPRHVVSSIIRRAKRSGIVSGRKLAVNWHKQDGQISFWLDVATVQGFLQRAA